MAKKKAPKLVSVDPVNPLDPLWRAHNRLDLIEKYRTTDLLNAGGGIKTLGDIVFTYHGNGVEGLNKADMEGIGLAIMSLGGYIELILEGMEGDLSLLRQQIAATGGAA
jgi:hypothetical protein